MRLVFPYSFPIRTSKLVLPRIQRTQRTSSPYYTIGSILYVIVKVQVNLLHITLYGAIYGLVYNEPGISVHFDACADSACVRGRSPPPPPPPPPSKRPGDETK